MLQSISKKIILILSLLHLKKHNIEINTTLWLVIVIIDGFKREIMIILSLLKSIFCYFISGNLIEKGVRISNVKANISINTPLFNKCN